MGPFYPKGTTYSYVGGGQAKCNIVCKGFANIITRDYVTMWTIAVMVPALVLHNMI